MKKVTESKNSKAPNKTDIYAGKKLRTLRLKYKMSQRELASKLNITFQQVQKYEKGINRISIGMLYNICIALGVPPIQFLKDVSKATLKFAEKNDTTLLDDIIKLIKKLSIGKQKRLLEYIKILIEEEEPSGEPQNVC